MYFPADSPTPSSPLSALRLICISKMRHACCLTSEFGMGSDEGTGFCVCQRLHLVPFLSTTQLRSERAPATACNALGILCDLHGPLARARLSRALGLKGPIGSICKGKLSQPQPLPGELVCPAQTTSMLLKPPRSPPRPMVHDSGLCELQPCNMLSARLYHLSRRHREMSRH